MLEIVTPTQYAGTRPTILSRHMCSVPYLAEHIKN